LISDLQNFVEALQDPKVRSAIKHTLGEEMRVRKVIDKGKTSTTRAATAAELQVPPSTMTNQSGTYTTTSSFRIWSSVSFAYYQVSELDRLLGELDKMTGGLGVVPTAIDIWNLIPWSWLIDWFTNFNHVVTNLSYLGRDGLYLQRGYLMATAESSETWTRRGTIYNRPYETTGTKSFVRKYRVKASPFGFGYTWKDFDPFQLSILGALGVSRLRF